jgi:hypothetical protein
MERPVIVCPLREEVTSALRRKQHWSHQDLTSPFGDHRQHPLDLPIGVVVVGLCLDRPTFATIRQPPVNAGKNGTFFMRCCFSPLENNLQPNIHIVMKTQNLYSRRLVMTAVAVTGLLLSTPVTFADDTNAKSSPPPQQAEPQSEQSKSVNPQVQSEVEKKADAKRAQLLKDAQVAIDETRKALAALDQNKNEEALAALERVTGKLDLILARDPKLALAPVSMATVVRDMYANSDTVKDAIKEARSELSDGKVQQARALLGDLASEVELQVTNIPLATYPEAIKAVAPLIDAGKKDEAKTALQTALNTLVIQRFITPLPTIRATAMLAEAEKLAEKSGRSSDENQKLHDLVENARQQLELGETLGYSKPEDYKPLYAQLDSIQSKTGNGKSGKGFFDAIKESLKDLKDPILQY